MAPTPHHKLRRQLQAAIAEGTAALAAGRANPDRTGRRAFVVVLGLVAAGTATALALDEDLRTSVLGSAKALGEEIASKGAWPGEEAPEPK